MGSAGGSTSWHATKRTANRQPAGTALRARAEETPCAISIPRSLAIVLSIVHEPPALTLGSARRGWGGSVKSVLGPALFLRSGLDFGRLRWGCVHYVVPCVLGGSCAARCMPRVLAARFGSRPTRFCRRDRSRRSRCRRSTTTATGARRVPPSTCVGRRRCGVGRTAPVHPAPIGLSPAAQPPMRALRHEPTLENARHATVAAHSGATARALRCHVCRPRP